MIVLIIMIMGTFITLELKVLLIMIVRVAEHYDVSYPQTRFMLNRIVMLIVFMVLVLLCLLFFCC